MRRAEIISLKTTIQTDTIKHLRIRNSVWQKVQKYDINKQNQKKQYCVRSSFPAQDRNEKEHLLFLNLVF